MRTITELMSLMKMKKVKIAAETKNAQQPRQRKKGVVDIP